MKATVLPLFLLFFVTAAHAQTYQVTGTPDADGFYSQREETFSGLPVYKHSESGLHIVRVNEGEATGCGRGAWDGDYWFIVSQDPVADGCVTDSPSDILYFMASSANTPEGAYNKYGGASASATVQASELPVELVRFEAITSGRHTLLQWDTASELNNAGFEIQHQQDATWQPLGFVDGHGTTLEAQAYSYQVENLAPGTHRFRLKQVDYDGAFDYSPEVEVTVALAESHQLSAAYPNPFNPQTSFTLTVAARQHVTVAVYDVLGRQVAALFNGSMEAQQAQAFTFEAGSLPSGLYVLRASGETFTATQLLTLVK